MSLELKEEIEVKEPVPSIFKNRNFLLLSIGQLVSNIGNALHSVALAVFIMNLVGENLSGTYIAIIMACALIPSIVIGPLSGVFVDRLDRKKIIYGTDLIRGLLFIGLSVLINFNIYPMISLCIVTVLSSFFSTFFNPAVSASIPNVVSEEQLVQANSISGMIRTSAFIFGGFIAGFLYIKFNFVGILIINGISFILSGISEMFIDLPKNEKSDKKFNKHEFKRDFIDGIKYVKKDRLVIVLMSFALVLNFLFNPIFSIVFPKTIKFTLGLGAVEIGIFNAIFPIGMFIGMLILSILKIKDKAYKIILTSLLIQCTIFTLFGVPIIPSIQKLFSNYSIFTLYCVLAGLLAIFNAIINVPMATVFQKRVSDEYRGRFFGMLSTLSQGIVPLGLGVFGVLADILHPSVLFISAGLISITLSIWMLFIPELKEI